MGNEVFFSLLHLSVNEYVDAIHMGMTVVSMNKKWLLLPL